MFVRILRWVLGYIQITLSGECPERILTILSRNRLPFWDIKQRGGNITICLYAHHFKKLRILRRGVPSAINISKRRGLPFLLRRYRRRWAFALGLVLFFLINWVASMFIWNIQIEGNFKTDSQVVLDYLLTQGVREGILAKNIDCDNIRVRMTKDFEDISWASLTIEGSQLTVSLHERHPMDLSAKEPCNLIASRDGVIHQIRALTGRTAVKQGETVTRGQLLVSGVLEYTTGKTEFVAATGEIFARTIRDITVTQPLKYIETRRTGEMATRRVLSFFGLNIPLYIGGIDRAYEKDLVLSRPETATAYLPIYLATANFYFTEERMINLTEENARQMALKKMEELCDQIADYEISSYEDTYTTEDGNVILNRHIQAIENIAKSEKIEINNANP